MWFWGETLNLSFLRDITFPCHEFFNSANNHCLSETSFLLDQGLFSSLDQSWMDKAFPCTGLRQDLAMFPRLTSNCKSSSYSFLRAGITVARLEAWLYLSWKEKRLIICCCSWRKFHIRTRDVAQFARHAEKPGFDSLPMASQACDPSTWEIEAGA